MATSKLSDKALKVKLTIRRVALTKRDDSLTSTLQAQQNDTGLTVLTKLFRDKTSPIYTIMQAVNAVYTYHIENTLPYEDKGPRLLPSAHSMEYCAGMQHLMGVVDSLVKAAMPNYDALVLADVAYRNQGRAAGTASAADYPSAAEFESKVKFELKFSPLPDEDHPLFDLSEQDRQGFRDQIAETAAAARTDTIRRMLEPLGHLVAKLNAPIGDKDSVFRDSAIQNVVEGCRMARKLMLEPDAALVSEIVELERLVSGYAFGVSQLRESPDTRADAAARLAEASRKMADYFS